jgi:dTDP-D-glucose 4,6-dehydratase
LFHQFININAMGSSTLLDTLKESAASPKASEAKPHKNFYRIRVSLNNVSYDGVFGYFQDGHLLFSKTGNTDSLLIFPESLIKNLQKSAIK